MEMTMATLARVKWKAGKYLGSGADGAKYLAELSFMDDSELVAKDLERNLKEHKNYQCKIMLYRTPETITPETIYQDTFPSLQAALGFFANLVTSTGAQHCEDTWQDDFRAPAYTNQELANSRIEKSQTALEEAVQRITGSIEELAEAIARQK